MVTGGGLLAAAIGAAARALGGDTIGVVDEVELPEPAAIAGLFDTGAGTPYPVLVTARDAWDVRDYDQIRAACDSAGVAWLPVHTELGRVVVGPWYTPGAAGCALCARLRRSLADDHDAHRGSAWPATPDWPARRRRG